jgi:hypothetical protein
MLLRRQGVYGKNLPTKKSGSVQASQFSIGGMIALMERRFDHAFDVSTPQDVAAIFGNQVDPAAYGPDVVDGFFKTLMGQNGKLYLYSPPNCATGSPGALTDTQASMALPDGGGTAQLPLMIKPGYQTYPEYGTGGNRTGVRIEVGNRFATALTANATATDVAMTLDSVADFHKGDIVKIVCSGGTVPATVYLAVDSVNASLKQVIFAAAFGTVAFPLLGDAVSIPGFKIRTYRKTIDGVESEVDVELGKQWLGLNPLATAYYPPNVFEASSWIVVTMVTTTTVLASRMPVAQATTVYPGSTVANATLVPATDGAAITTEGQLYRALHAFDSLPVRFLGYSETTDAAIQKSGETYCKSRDDNPVWIGLLPESRTKAQLITLGNNWQRADEVDAVLVGHWGKRTDPFQSSPMAAPRHVPLIGHVMGLACQGIEVKGIHASCAQKDMTLQGLVGIVGTQFTSDTDRTDLANAGINCVEFVTGYGYCLRNFLTPSTVVEFQFANGVVMRNYIKVSAVDSLQLSENTPNSLNRIASDATAIEAFLRKVWDHGSTGNVAAGESFGQEVNLDGSYTKFEDHVDIRADAVNNPTSSLQAGNRNVDVYFTYPAPAGSIQIGVGIMMRG